MVSFLLDPAGRVGAKVGGAEEAVEDGDKFGAAADHLVNQDDVPDLDKKIYIECPRKNILH